ncbi:MAG: 2-amino-4-hydroxy-6-hydroxymethyldihydropteridine diphosphokinase [Pseudohongiellaceae bacterium]|nr:2-amino-4-hydroxy-6-hydroxymethyldihydropteridine diphosphokinase [Pseudohongiellaceae bacterium]
MPADIDNWVQDSSAPICIIGIGSNLPTDSTTPQENVERAIEALHSLSDEALCISSLWQSAPIDCPPDSPHFVNAVVALLAREQSAYRVLEQLQAIENHFGRRRCGVVNEPRVLDLDLLSFAQVQQDDPVLTLPHPRAHQRRFVLEPLAEIAGNHVLPGFDKNIDRLLRELDLDDSVQKIESHY